jgi:microcystin-dependent protein
MSVVSRIYDSTNYTQALIAEIFASLISDGYASGLAVSATAPASMAVSVALGRAFIQGFWYKSDAANVLTIAAADPANPRIDRIVIRLETGGAKQVTARVLTGTPAGSPSAPALTQTAAVWEISLAQIAVAAAASSIVAGNITDERGSSAVCGRMAMRRARFSELIVTGNINLGGYKVTGLANPSAAAHAVNKTYFDAGLTGGVFGVNKCVIIPWPASTLPAGFLECNGQSLVRASYPALFTAFSTTFGAADGTHFNLPDLRGRNPYGATSALGATGGEKTHVLSVAEMPGHTHTLHTTNQATNVTHEAGANPNVNYTNSGQTEDTGSGTAHNNLQPYTTMKYIVYGS